MKLSDIFDSLTYGELSQIALGGATENGINEHNYTRILTHINLGLTELHKRFLLKQREVTLQLSPDRLMYVLDKTYAKANRESYSKTKYILDSSDSPFQDDVLKIERVFDSFGNELGLNSEAGRLCVREGTSTLGVPAYPRNEVPRVFTPSYNTLRVPATVKGDSLTVVYRANHPQIVNEVGYFELDTVTVDLPMSHLEPLLYYVASRVLNPVGMSQEFHEGNNYAAKFEQSCTQLMLQDMEVDSGEDTYPLTRNGWV